MLIIEVKVFNVTAVFGGALAISSQSQAIVKNSSFTGCSANSVGALFLQNTAFLIENCIFLRNSVIKGSGEQ